MAWRSGGKGNPKPKKPKPKPKPKPKVVQQAPAPVTTTTTPQPGTTTTTSPPSSGIKSKEFFEIEDFIEQQNYKIRAREWKAYVNRNQKKLNQYWQSWHKRTLTQAELYRLASGSDETKSPERFQYSQNVETWQQSLANQQKLLKQISKKDTKRYNKIRKDISINKKRLAAERQKMGAYDKTAGKGLQELLAEYEKIQQYEAVKYGLLQGSGYNINVMGGGI